MKIILGLAGEIASGKGTISKYIVKKYGGVSYRFSDPLRDILKRIHREIDRKNLHRISMALRKYFGEDIFSEVIFKDIKTDKKNVIVLDGVRRVGDIQHLKNIKGFKLIFVEADMKVRYGRLKKRKENKDDEEKNMRSFRKEHESEVERKIRKLKKTADFVVGNNGGTAELYRQIDQIISKISKKNK